MLLFSWNSVAFLRLRAVRISSALPWRPSFHRLLWKEVGDFHFKSRCQRGDHEQGGIPFTPFDPTNIRPVMFGAVGKLHLAPTTFLAEGAQMLYRLIIAIVALALFPSASQCESLALEMTTATNINLNCAVVPSIATFSFNGSSSDSSIVGFLPDLLKTRVSGNLSASGHVDLSFNLIVGSETLSQTGTYSFRSYSNTGPIGAPGATASLRLEGPIVFNSKIGTFTINYSTVYSNLLGKPHGSVDNDHLFVRMQYVRVPEPSTAYLSVFTWILLSYAKRVI